jgi:hypothetical protein
VTDPVHRFRSGDAYLGRPQRLRPRASAQLLKLPVQLSVLPRNVYRIIFLDSFARAHPVSGF